MAPAAERRLTTWFAGVRLSATEPARVAFLIATLLSASCAPHAGDVVHTFGVSNRSDHPLIVRFATWGNDYLAPAGAAGIAAQGFGAASGPIRLLDIDCRVLQEVPVTTQRGYLTIDAARVATLTQTDSMPTGFLERTEQCPVD